ncbi:MAG: S41 family peptidase [Pseudomonadota bacterium]
MNKRCLPALWVSLGLVLGVFVSVGGRLWADTSEPLPVKELRMLAEIFGRIKSDYVEPVTDKVLLENAIRGMLSGLDPHSSYLAPDEFKELQEGTSGEFGGLGIEIGLDEGAIKIISPIDDTPAHRAGLRPGDLIIRIDDKPVKGLGLTEAVGLMRGPPGSPVVLTIARPGLETPFKVTLVRDIIKVDSVKARLLEAGFGLLRISHFQSHTYDEMMAKLGELKKTSKGPLKGLVLDLRNNPGGTLQAAVAVSDAFLKEGKIVYTEGRVEDSKMTFFAGPDDVLNGAPMVVLVNGGSASASEIVAGALQDHKRGILVGEPTFGKGSVQTIIPIAGEGAIKLTTARYYTPKGRSIQAEGIVPDIALAEARLEPVKAGDVKPIKEADLKRHLGKPGGEGGGDSGNKPSEPKDYVVDTALNLLKGLALARGGSGS